VESIGEKDVDSAVGLTVCYPTPFPVNIAATYRMDANDTKPVRRVMKRNSGRNGGKGYPNNAGAHNWGIPMAALPERSDTMMAITLAHEVGHFLGLAHRDLPSQLISPSDTGDGIPAPHDRNIMDIMLGHDDPARKDFFMPRYDFDLLQVMAAHGLPTEPA
jgi:hypothetical protein